MLEKLLTVAATLPKDASAAALVGRVDRPGLGPSVVRVNPDATVTDITAAFPTVSSLCNHADPAAELRSAQGEEIGGLAGRAGGGQEQHPRGAQGRIHG